MRWVIWSVYVVLFTVLLVAPSWWAVKLVPSDESRFTLAKTLHMSAYAFFAALSGWLRVRPDRRWLLLLVLSAHAGGTELIQSFVPSRVGSWHDVTLNHTGLYVGVLLSWRWWRSEADLPPGTAPPANLY